MAVAIQNMRREDRYVLHGFAACSCGLALRNRKGSCINCYPKQLEVIFRYTEPGCVYVLVSFVSGLVKIGATENTAAVRAANLNKKGYAGAADWSVVDWVVAKRRGLLEDQLKAALRPHLVQVPFTDGISGKETYSRETYDCGLDHVQRMLHRVRRNYLKMALSID